MQGGYAAGPQLPKVRCSVKFSLWVCYLRTIELCKLFLLD
jgi:hypothetical protein